MDGDSRAVRRDAVNDVGARTCVVGGASREELLALLAARGIALNEYARTLLAHRSFEERESEHLEVLQRSLEELGLPRGGTLPEIFAAVGARGLAPLPPDAGPYLRLAVEDQEPAPDSVLSAGRAPTGAVHVLSAPLSADHDHPRGFYLRVVDGVPWLRGFRCDDEYLWPPDAVFAVRAPSGASLRPARGDEAKHEPCATSGRSRASAQRREGAGWEA